MKKRKFKISLHLVDRVSGDRVQGLRVEAWDKDLLINDLIGSGITDKKGTFEFIFDESYFSELFVDRKPDLFFKVYQNDRLIRSTEDSILWNVDAGNHVFDIEIDQVSTSPKPISWSGKHEFAIVGTQCREDTLKIEANFRKSEMALELVLPTLCITYADMKFQNAVGGEQKNYPDSRVYGPAHFDPPVEINGYEKVEKLTWIRGAHRVVIGSKKTIIEWHAYKNLVIPRLRIDSEKPLTGTLSVPSTTIHVDKELIIDVRQFGDGRHIGGIRVEKRHPEWKPSQVKPEYDLWVRVVNGETLEPFAETPVNILHWNPGVAGRKGEFKLVKISYTDANGAIYEPHRPCGELEAVTVSLPGWHVDARCFRPLPGQPVNFHMRAWHLQKGTVPVKWKPGNTVEAIGLLTGFGPQAVFDTNRIVADKRLTAGMELSLPCFAASYRAQSNDDLSWLVKTFGYADIEELAKVNGMPEPSKLYSRDIILPGWHFLYARRGDSLESIEKMFELPPGSARIVGLTHHPNPKIPYPSETIAIPTG